MADPIFDRVSPNHTVSNGGLTVTATAAGWQTSESSIPLPAATPVYFEFVLDTAVGNNNFVGILSASIYPNNLYCGQTVTSWSYFGATGDKSTNGAQTGYGASWTALAVVGVLYYPSTGNIYFCKNGVWQGATDGGSPVGKAAAFTGLTGTMYPAVTTYAAGSAFTARFIAADIPNVSHVPSGVQIGLLAAPPTYGLFTHLMQPYTIHNGDVISAVLDQLYAIPETINSLLLQSYSILIEIWSIQTYGDVPQMLRAISQPYASAPTLNKSLSQPWADALALSASLEQPWTMPGELAASSEQRYGIAAAVLMKTSEQLYHINANTTLFANLAQPYAIAAEAAMLYYVDTKLFVAGVQTPYISAEWQDGGEYALSCDLTLAGQDIAARCQDGVEIRIDSAGESWFFQCVGGWRLDKRFASEVYHVSGLSRTCALDEGPRLLGDIGSGMASQIVTDLAAPYGITVDWQMADGYLPPGKISAADETSLAIIGKIVWDAKGKIMSTRDGNLLIVCEEETPVPEWPTVTPAATIVARLERVSTSEQHDKQPGYNRFIVSDQTAAGGNFNLEYQEIDPYTKEVRLFITPIDGRAFYLTTSGGAPATIEPFGVTVLPVVDELVEFKEGTGNTQRPIYGINAMSWLRDDLGAIPSFTEAGILTAEVAGYSLLKISYVSRYHKWLGRDRNIETVQFIAHEVKTT